MRRSVQRLRASLAESVGDAAPDVGVKRRRQPLTGDTWQAMQMLSAAVDSALRELALWSRSRGKPPLYMTSME